MKTDWEIRREIVHFAKCAYKKGLVAATDGNISVRIMGDRLMITPTGAVFETLLPDDLIYVNFLGQKLQGNSFPSSELPMHLEIYRQRPDVDAIIHAHPPVATAFTIAGESLAQPVIPEVVSMYGKIPTATYATPATEESAMVIRDLIHDHDLILLDHHGAVAVGRSVEDAFLKLEKLEHTASTLLAAKQLGEIKPLSAAQLQKLKDIHYK
jgi:L-fuculose-phosphate aldolase